MKKFIKSQTALQVVACAVIATFVIAGVVSAASTIGANVTTTGTLSVTGASTLTGAVTTGAGATVGTDLTVTSGTRVGTGSSGGHVTALADDSLLVEGQTEFDGTAWFDGSLRASSTLMVTDAATLYSTFNVAGATTLDGNVTLGNGTSDIITPTGYFTYARIGTGSTFGNIGAVGADELGVEGNVEVDGTAWFDGALTNAGLGTFSGGLTSTATTTISGRIQGASPLLLEGATANDGFETTIAVTDPTADRTITLQDNTGLVPLSTAANTLFFTTTAATALTLPTTGTLSTLAGTETLTNKTLTSPTIGTAPTAAGATWADLGAVTTADINGGTIDGVTIGAGSAGAGTFAAIVGTGLTVNGNAAVTGNLTVGGNFTLGDAAADTLTVYGATILPSLTATSSTPFVLEGATADDFETTIAVTDPTADNTITLPNGTGTVYITGGTDVTVADGGTGASTLTDGGILLGSGTDAVTPMAVLTDGQIVVGDGTTDPVALAAFTSSTGQLKHESGGLEADVSAYSGLVKITGGAASAVTVTTAGEALLDDANAAAQLVTLGVTSDAAELNILDGVTAAAAELNYVDITTLGTAASSKALTLSSGGVLTLADAQLVDFGAIVHNDAAAQGLRLPNSAGAPTAITANPEGHIAWDASNNLLYVSTDAGWASTFNNTASANTWTDNQIYTFLGNEDIAITHDAGAAADILNIIVTPSAVDAAVKGIRIDQAASANTNGIDIAIEIDNSDDSVAITDGLLFSSAGGVITDAIDASATQIVNAINVGANTILGGAAVIDFTEFDVDANGNILVGNGYGIDANAAGALKIGVTTATTIDYGSAAVTAHTFVANTTGTATVVLPAGAIDSTEILDATITTSDLSATAGITAAQLATKAKTNTMAVRIADISTAETLYVMMPKCTVTRISSVLSGVIAVGNANIVAYNVDTGITDGTLAIAFGDSAAGVIDTTLPSANNTFDGSTQYLKLVGDGGSTNAVPVIVTIEYTMTD